MGGETSYGSSEYSAEAEELFAAYVVRRKAGEEVDFEALCAEHDALADELYGLHTDWDNVASLLGRLKEREPAGEVPEAEEPEPEEPEELVEATHLDAPPASSSGWKWLSAAGLLLAIGAGALAFSLFRDKGVLAQEKQTLSEEKAGLLEVRRELEAQGSTLALELDAERNRAESAQESARRASELSAVLSARLGARTLLAEAPELQPTHPGSLAAMEAWLSRADSLRARADALGSSDPTLVADLAAIEGDDGARERIEARAELLRRVAAETTAEDELAWSSALEEIADRLRSPGYAGLALEPHFALVPLGREPWSGLWLFADRRTGSIPERDGDGELRLEAESALILLLHPGSAGDGVPPFLVAVSELRPEHWERAGLTPESDELGYAAPTAAQALLVGTMVRPVLAAPRRRGTDSP